MYIMVLASRVSELLVFGSRHVTEDQGVQMQRLLLDPSRPDILGYQISEMTQIDATHFRQLYPKNFSPHCHLWRRCSIAIV